MTLDEFLEALTNTGLRWQIAPLNNGRIRTKNLPSFCPITAVCYNKRHKFYDVHEYSRAAMDLGLDGDIASNIVDAADNRGYFELREKLLKATRLST